MEAEAFSAGFESRTNPSQDHTSLARTLTRVRDHRSSSRSKAGLEGQPESTNLKGLRVICAPQGPTLQCQRLGKAEGNASLMPLLPIPAQRASSQALHRYHHPSEEEEENFLQIPDFLCLGQVGG